MPSANCLTLLRRLRRPARLAAGFKQFARHCALLCSLLLLGIANSQAALPGLAMGIGGVSNSTTASVRDSAGNLYVSGYFGSGSITIGSTTLNNIGILDAFVAKLDASGQVLWAKNFGGAGVRTNSAAAGLAVDGAGNIYLAGSSNGGDMTTPALANIGATDVFALKLDNAGNVLWAKRYGGSGVYASASGLGLDSSNNVYFAGYFGYGDMTTPALTKIGTRDSYLLKLDSDGNLQWAKNYGGSGSETGALGLAVDSSGNSHLSGYFSQNLSTPALTRIGANDAFAIKVDNAGDVSWAKGFGGGGATAMAYGIAVDGSGNSYVAGLFQSANLSTPALTRLGSRDAFIFKLAADGSTTWAKNYGGSGAITDGRGVAVDSAGRIYLTGHFSNASLTTPAIGAIGYQDGFALKLTAAGDIAWQQAYGGWHAYVTNSGAMIDSNGKLYYTGKYSGAALTTPALSAPGADNGLLLRQIAAYVPGLPTAVTATPLVSRISVSFTAPVDGGSTAISGYTVTASPAGGVDADAGSTATSHTFSGLSDGVSYTFTVTARNSEGSGEASAASSAVSQLSPPPPPPPPPPTETMIPAGGVATLGKLPAISSGGGTLNVPADSTGGSLSLLANASSSAAAASTTLLIGGQRIVVQPLNGAASLTLLRTSVQGQSLIVLRLDSGSLAFSAGSGQGFLLFGNGILSSSSQNLQAVLSNGRVAVSSGSASFSVLGNSLSSDDSIAIYAGEVLEKDSQGRLGLRVGSLDGNEKLAGDPLPAISLERPVSVQLNGPLGRLAGQSPLMLLAAAFQQPTLRQAADGSLLPDLHVLPLAIRIDRSASDGLRNRAGLTEVASNGVVVQLAPLVIDAPAFLKELDRLNNRQGSASFHYVQADGVTNIVSSPRQFVLRYSLPTPGANLADGLHGDGQGNWQWVSQGQAQTLCPSFRYAEQLAAALAAGDPQASLSANNDGTYSAIFNGQSFLLRPDLEVLNLFSMPAAHLGDRWWQEQGKLFINYGNMTGQGFSVR